MDRARTASSIAATAWLTAALITSQAYAAPKRAPRKAAKPRVRKRVVSKPARPSNKRAAQRASTATAPQVGPSCDGGPGAGNDCNGHSCCSRIRVAGGSFHYTHPGAIESNKATVADFQLDRFEATVGRFKSWVKAGSPLPKVGAKLGTDLLNKPVRWSSEASTHVQRGKRLAGWDKYDTWTAGKFRSPKNSVNWYTAAAFCHWDGGRLPTEKEWQYTAVGGEQARPYPWGDQTPTYQHAVFNCQGDGNKSCDLVDLVPVGSRPKGAGRWGHLDLVGSVFEWTITFQGSTGKQRGRSKGGGFCYIGGLDRRAPLGLNATTARLDNLKEISHMVGVRCAYDAPKPASKAKRAQ